MTRVFPLPERGAGAHARALEGTAGVRAAVAPPVEPIGSLFGRALRSLVATAGRVLLPGIGLAGVSFAVAHRDAAVAGAAIAAAPASVLGAHAPRAYVHAPRA